jgi:aspartate aminotransferase-like enzyme
MLPDCGYTKLMLGTGFGELLYAIRLAYAGISPKDSCIVDSAGAFGRAWYEMVSGTGM